MSDKEKAADKAYNEFLYTFPSSAGKHVFEQGYLAGYEAAEAKYRVLLSRISGHFMDGDAYKARNLVDWELERE